MEIKPTATTIDLTEGCNLACDYCFTHSNHKARKLPFELGKRIINWWLPQTNKSQKVDLTFWGGEPLLEWKLLQKLVLYTEELNKGLGRNIEFGGTTNGVLFTPDKAEWGLKHNLYLMFSIDGIKPAHDEYRKFPNGNGSFDIVVKNFKAVQKVFPRIKARASISAFSVPYFFETIQFFVEELGMNDIAFSPVCEDDWNNNILEQLEEQFDLIINYIVKQHKEGNPIKLKHIHEEASMGCIERKPENPCGAGRTYSGWSIDGYCFPCHRFNKHGLTTKQRSKLSTIIARPKGKSFEWCNYEWHRQFPEFKNNVSKECSECEIFRKSHCQGGCYAVNWDLTGDLHKAPRSECDYNKIQHKASMKFKKLMESAGIKIPNPGWDNNNSCVCYNMCYQEGTQEEIIHIDRRNDITCICNNMNYSGKRDPQHRGVQELDKQREAELRIINAAKNLCNKGILEKEKINGNI